MNIARITRLLGVTVPGLLLLLTINAWGQSFTIVGFDPVEPADIQFPDGSSPPSSFAAALLDIEMLKEDLMGVPSEAPGRIDPAVQFEILLPNGRPEPVAIARSPVMEEDLAVQFPELQSYVFESVDNPGISGRMAVGPDTLHVFARIPGGLLRIDPFETLGGTVYLSYFNSNRTDGADDFDHPADETVPDSAPVPLAANLMSHAFETLHELKRTPLPRSIASGTELRTYRLAAATTGEYYQSRNFGNELLDVLFSLIVEVNNINVLFESELSVRLVLALGTLELIYDDPDNDPFENFDLPETDDGDPDTTTDVEGEPCDLREENFANTVAELNADDYDLGFLFTVRSGGGGSGCAWFVVCLDDKARGAGKIGLDNTPLVGSGTGLLAHEVGHMLGANHTYSGALCDEPNFSETGTGPKPSAYAPGSGSTIMSYSGNCGDDNVEILASENNFYYHSASWQQIAENTQNGDGADCGTTSATGNQVPTVDAGPDYTIPRETPFTLLGSADDPDLEDLPWLTYAWEQFDLAEDQRPIDTDDGEGPIIRSRQPSTNPNRTIPRLQDLLSGTPRKGEILPEMDRELNFRLTVRDNRAGGGGVNHDEMVVTVAGDPFFVTYPNGGEVLSAGCIAVATWEPGGSADTTDLVDLLLSGNGGLSFLIPFVAGTENDGGQAGVLPCLDNDTMRLKAQGVNNIFFDISDADFEIEQEAPQISGSATGGEVDGQCQFEVTFEATVTDDCGVAAADVMVDVTETTGNATLGVPTVNVAQNGAATVDIDGSVLVSDLTDSPATVRVSIDAEDNCGLQTSRNLFADVSDTTPPTIDVALDPDTLWPPNHKMIDITAEVVAEDNCGIVSFVLDSVTSDEPDDATGDGRFFDDIQGDEPGNADILFQLRAERMQQGDGRTYTATYTATDGSGNEATDSATVEVPANQKP